MTAISAVSGDAVQAIGLPIRPSHQQQVVDHAEHVVEHPGPHLGRDHGRDRPGDQDRGAQQAAAAESARRGQRDASRGWSPRSPRRGEHQGVPDCVPPVRVLQQVDVVEEADELRPDRSDRLASVKLNQMVRSSGQPATSASTISIGAMNSQAERTRCRVRRDAFSRNATCLARRRRPRCSFGLRARSAPDQPVWLSWRATATPRFVGAARRPARYQRPPRESRSSLLSRPSRVEAASVLPLSTSWTALKNSELTWLYFSAVTVTGAPPRW